MTKKHTYEQVKKEFEARGFRLISDTYINARTKLKYICSCGNESEITYDNMKSKGHTCKKCASLRIAKQLKTSNETVKKAFEDRGYILLSTTYANAKSKMEYICKCGNKSKITYDEVNAGHTCKKCAAKRTGSRNALPLQRVVDIFSEHGLKFDDTSYTNSHTPIRYVCKCGNIDYKTLESIQKGRFCDKCSGRCVVDYERVKQDFASRGCSLIDTNVENVRQKLRYVCSCGSISLITYDRFKSGGLCAQCSKIRTEITCLRKYGVNHYSKTNEFREKTKKTCMKKYGVTNYAKTQNSKDKFKKNVYKSMALKPIF